jgi:ubiquinone/menaquinone biosynthesis C-methylase UbiE
MPAAVTRGAKPNIARYYARTSQAMERGVARYRDDLLAALSGTVVEVGAGNGMNFAHYPSEVTSVLAVEPEPHLRGLAEHAAEQVPVLVEVVDGTAERLPAADRSIDAVVFSLVLCTVPDLAAALAEAARVLRPGGQVRFFEHVRAEGRLAYGVQRLLQTTVFPTLCGGCHPARDTKTAIETAGFAIDKLQHLSFADTRIPFPTSPQILGTATRPDQQETTP